MSQLFFNDLPMTSDESGRLTFAKELSVENFKEKTNYSALPFEVPSEGREELNYYCYRGIALTLVVRQLK